MTSRHPRPKPPRFAQLSALTPAPPAWEIAWPAIWALWPELPALDACPQDPVHHAEGDVGAHTRMVVEAMVADPAWRALAPEARAGLFWAAALHDVGKPATTVRDADGRISAPGHSRRGAAIARGLLWRAGAPFLWREALCGLIVAHQLPFWLIERPDPTRLAIETSWRCVGERLCLHARADALGRIAADQDRILENVALAEACFEEAGCLAAPFPFANDESRVAYFEREDRDPHYAAHAQPRCRAIVMAGLPGAGKDHWIRENAADLPVVSLDAIRAEIGAPPTGDQGKVVQAAREAARTHLRAGRDFVWNATNVTRQIRAKTIGLLRAYDARVEIVYLEVPPARLLRQNRDRARVVPTNAILAMAGKLEPPALWEAHAVTAIVNGASV